jgi:hypothetical protein
MDWSTAAVWCLPGVCDVLRTPAPYLALEEAYRLAAGVLGRGLHSFPFQLNLSSFVHRIIQLNS